MTNWEERFERRPRRTAINVGLSTVVVLAVVGVGATVIFGATNFLTQAGRVVSKTIDADNVIYNYEWFRQQYQDVLAMDGKIAVQQAAHDAATDTAERSRIASIVAGLRTKRAQMVADYNARASMANRSIFMGGLPEQIA